MEVKINDGNGLGYKSSAGLLEGWLGKSKVKGGNFAKDSVQTKGQSEVAAVNDVDVTVVHPDTSE